MEKARTMENLPLKLDEALNREQPWADDALQRNQVAEALTNLLAEEPGPLVLSLNGAWGTGKTFLLKRWQLDLKKQGFTAIYFNAWEDDYCGDPLVAIIGQLWEEVKGSDLKETVNTLKETAGSFITQTVFNAVRVGTGGVVDIDPKKLKSIAETALDDYLKVRCTKQDLKDRLAELAQEAAKRKGHPLIFIVDELDRCRPTFAIEMLERIKHIFDIPHLVFVLGLDREQLAESIHSVYGKIDVDGYLRRFFDMDFNLPAADSKVFCQHIGKRWGLFKQFSEKANATKYPATQKEYDALEKAVVTFLASFALSLRDAEYLFRLIVFSERNIGENEYVLHQLILVLVVLRGTRHDLYARFVKGDETVVPEVIDYIVGRLESSRLCGESAVDHYESLLYLMGEHEARRNEESPVAKELAFLADGSNERNPACLSKRARSMNTEQAQALHRTYMYVRGDFFGRFDHSPREYLPSIVKRIELGAAIISGPRR